LWKDGPRALYGMCVEDMPNFAQLYGVNSNLGHNSIILMIEAQSRYINGLIGPVLEARAGGRALSLTPRLDVLDRYNATLQSELQRSAFGDPRCHSWYKNDAGLITNNWSRTVVEYQKMVETVDLADFVVDGSGAERVRGKTKVHVGRVREETLVSDRALVLATGAVTTAALLGGWMLRNSRYLQSVKAR
jgi:hypothetical protein